MKASLPLLIALLAISLRSVESRGKTYDDLAQILKNANKKMAKQQED